jgi:hypothetical protein
MDPGPLTHKREKKVPLWDTARWFVSLYL